MKKKFFNMRATVSLLETYESSVSIHRVIISMRVCRRDAHEKKIILVYVNIRQKKCRVMRDNRHSHST